MNLLRWLRHGGLALSCGCAPLVADDLSYEEGARAHPFMPLESVAGMETGGSAGISLDGFALVGTLAQGGRYQALVLDRQGVVRRLRLGESLADRQAVLVEVTQATARFESQGIGFTLSLEEGEEMSE